MYGPTLPSVATTRCPAHPSAALGNAHIGRSPRHLHFTCHGVASIILNCAETRSHALHSLESATPFRHAAHRLRRRVFEQPAPGSMWCPSTG
jgi:hypothetical protein